MNGPDGPLVEVGHLDQHPHPAPGHCLRCRARCFEVRAAAMIGPTGWPTRLGAPLPTFAWLAFQFETGRPVPVPLCRACAAEPGDMAILWEQTVAASRYNAEQRIAAGLALDGTEADALRWRAVADARAARNRTLRPVALVSFGAASR